MPDVSPYDLAGRVIAAFKRWGPMTPIQVHRATHPAGSRNVTSTYRALAGFHEHGVLHVLSWSPVGAPIYALTSAPFAEPDALPPEGKETASQRQFRITPKGSIPSRFQRKSDAQTSS